MFLLWFKVQKYSIKIAIQLLLIATKSVVPAEVFLCFNCGTVVLPEFIFLVVFLFIVHSQKYQHKLNLCGVQQILQ